METPSPFTPLGAKGLAEGNCMSTPACIANAVADALGVKDISLPLTPRRMHALIAGAEPPPPARGRQAPVEPAEKRRGWRAPLRGHGSVRGRRARLPRSGARCSIRTASRR